MEDLFLEWVDLDPTDPADAERARSIHEQVKALRFIVSDKLRLRTMRLVAPGLDRPPSALHDADYLDAYPEGGESPGDGADLDAVGDDPDALES